VVTNNQENTAKKKSFKTLIRMIVYTCLAIGFVTALYFNPRVQTEYYLQFGSLEGTWVLENPDDQEISRLTFSQQGDFHAYYHSEGYGWMGLSQKTWRREGRKVYFLGQKPVPTINFWTREGLFLQWGKTVDKWHRVSLKPMAPTPIVSPVRIGIK